MRTASTITLLITLALGLSLLAGCATTSSVAFSSETPVAGGDIVIRVASGQNADAFAAGKEAAADLKAQMGGTTPHVVIVAECFEEEALKRAALKGVAAIFPNQPVVGCSTYGSFGQQGCLDLDAITLMGIGGDGIAVAGALEPVLGIEGLTLENDEALLRDRLHAGGATLAGKLPQGDDNRLLMLFADAHSPKNQFLVEGVQKVTGPGFPVTGGSANKNAGQTFVYYNGRMYRDAAAALMLFGDFQVALAGRQAKTNEVVIASAKEAGTEALQKLPTEPIAAIAFNCAGRKGKLDRIEDELKALQDAVGTDFPLFGCYCAGEIGPADLADVNEDVLSSGVGWHLMLTLIGRN